MNITHAEHIELKGLVVTIDGHRFFVGDKRTILDLGFVLLMSESDDPGAAAWLSANTGGFPGGPDWGPLRGPGFIQDAILVELAIRDWNGEFADGQVHVPTKVEAEQALRSRGVPTLDLVNGRFEPRI